MTPSHESRQRGAPGRERRRHPRAPADWPLTIHLEDGAHTARLRDVSRAGVCFFMERPIPVMAVLGIRLEVPGEPGDEGPQAVLGSGAVVRCEKLSEHLEHYEIAVFLHDMAPADRGRLDEFVRTR